MILRMVQDLGRWLAVPVLCLFGFTAALRVFGQHWLEDECAGETTFDIATALWQSQLTGDYPDFCLSTLSSGDAVARPWAVFLLNIYLVLSYVLMANLLVALCACMHTALMHTMHTLRAPPLQARATSMYTCSTSSRLCLCSQSSSQSLRCSHLI